jgi:hypothetical protein
MSIIILNENEKIYLNSKKFILCQKKLFCGTDSGGKNIWHRWKTQQKQSESSMEEKNSGENEKAALLLLDRKSRATRGKRLSKLLDDEVQQDELFWSQDALKEEDEDDNYQEEAEIADEFDSDFDQDVSLSLSNSLTTIIN